MARDLKKARQNIERARDLALDAFNRVEERGSLVSKPLQDFSMQAERVLEHINRVLASLKKGVL